MWVISNIIYIYTYIVLGDHWIPKINLKNGEKKLGREGYSCRKAIYWKLPKFPFAAYHSPTLFGTSVLNPEAGFLRIFLVAFDSLS